LIVNTELVAAADRPSSIRNLTNSKWKGNAGIVRPVTGTTLTRLTALAHTLGEQGLVRFIDGILVIRTTHLLVRTDVIVGAFWLLNPRGTCTGSSGS
jgi:hypothetical protein